MDLTDFNICMRKLTSAFPQQKLNDEKAGFIYDKFRHLPAGKFEVLIIKLIETCKHSPSIAEMLEISRSLFPHQQSAPDVLSIESSLFTPEEHAFLMKIQKDIVSNNMLNKDSFIRDVPPLLQIAIDRKDRTMIRNLFKEIKETYYGAMVE